MIFGLDARVRRDVVRWHSLSGTSFLCTCFSAECSPSSHEKDTVPLSKQKADSPRRISKRTNPILYSYTMDSFKSPLFVSYSKCAIGKYFDCRIFCAAEVFSLL